jgi:hypothetical protein
MAGFLYFFPGVDACHVTPELIRGRGLAPSFRDLISRWQPGHNVIVAPISRGPSGTGGVYVYQVPINGNSPRTNGYKPEEQDWEEHDGYWLGVDTELMPTPADLIRPTIVSGYDYELGDGQEWTCPVIREPNGTESGRCNLPQSWGENGQGFFEKVLHQWDWAWELCAKVWDVFVGVIDMETPEAWDVCCQLLSMNYRIGKHEITKLGLVTSGNYDTIFKAAVDGDVILSLLNDQTEQKKSEQSEPISANSSDGFEVVSLDCTDHPEEQST